MKQRGDQPLARLAVTPGRGWIARRGASMLFLPPDETGATSPTFHLVVERFLDDGAEAVAPTDISRCIIDWSQPDGAVRIDSTVELFEHRSFGDAATVETRPIAVGVTELPRQFGRPHAIASDPGRGDVDVRGNLRDGDTPAGGFVLALPSLQPVDAGPAPTSPPGTRAEITAEPPQFDELTDLDVTLTPIGPVSYPDDDTDRTFRRVGDIRCPRGHVNPGANHTCRVCGAALDSTADRRGPRSSTAAVGLRLPDGSVIPINQSMVIGRSPDAAAARLDGSARLVPIEAPGTVSRTHVVIHLDDGRVSVTDCDARGRTAVVRRGDPSPVALVPWEPRAVRIGDTIKLGGPTTLTITSPEELRVPPSLEPTAPPPERDETT